MNVPLITPANRAAQRLVNAQRLVQLCIVLGLLWKIKFFLWSDQVYLDYALSDPFFPDWLESQWTLRIAFTTAVISGCMAMVLKRRSLLVPAIASQLGSLSVLLLHQGSYNDMTFLTSWWTSLWCLWLVAQFSDVNDEVIVAKQATRLACVILSLIMLGAAVGKWTDEYWSGTVLYEIYFRDRDFWLFNLLRRRLEEAELRQVAMLHSRAVIVSETLAALTLWCLPTRIAGGFGLLLMLLIPATSNWLLFSVTLSLVGLSSAVIMLGRR